MLHCSWWSPFSPAAYPAFSSESHQFMNSSSFIVGQPCADTSYGPAAASPSFPPKSSDFPQVGDLMSCRPWHQPSGPLLCPRAAPVSLAGPGTTWVCQCRVDVACFGE
ncbi:hypothetical protein CB1_000097008 [Camelus ferus]|nr:hypothetical protein CB1_002199001 [Camelus ferus]EPY89535.1 hypothetical protein CB1_000097008 [Camelus ferus]